MELAFDDNMQLRLRKLWRHLSALDEAQTRELEDVLDTAALRELWDRWADIGPDRVKQLAEGFDAEPAPYRFPPLRQAA